jgi:hypothetical protein
MPFMQSFIKIGRYEWNKTVKQKGRPVQNWLTGDQNRNSEKKILRTPQNTTFLQQIFQIIFTP